MRLRSLLCACVIAFLTLFVFSCHKKQDVSPPYLSITETTLLIDSTIGAKDSMTVNSNTSWKLNLSPASAASWLQLSQTEGQGSTIIHLQVTAKNPDPSQPVIISSQATGNSSVPADTVTITQRGFLKTNRDALFWDGTPGTIDTVLINTNLAWKITASDPWLHFSVLQGTGPALVKVTADTNTTGNTLFGSVSITPVNNSSAAPVTISAQNNAFFGVLGFSPAKGPVGTTVTINGSFYPNSVVYIGGIKATIQSQTAATIVCTIPAGTVGTQFAIVAGNNYVSSANAFTITGGWNLRSSYISGVNASPGAVSFVYNGSFYCGLGDNTTRTIARFDTTTYRWTPDITIPAAMSPRIHAFSFQMNNKVYIGGGYATTPSYSALKDVWEFDPTLGNSAAAWRRLTDFPDDATGCFAFAIGTTAYVQTGINTYLANNMCYEFFLSSPTDAGNWVPFKALNVQNHPASGFLIGNTAYLGGGSQYDLTQATAFYSYTPNPGAGLTAVASLPEAMNPTGTDNSPAFAMGGKGYIVNYTSEKMYQYDPNGNAWSLFSTIPNSAINGAWHAAAIGNRIFVWGANGTPIEYIP